MAKSGIANVLAEGINGWIRGTGIQRDMDRQKKEDDWRDEQRSNSRADRQRAEDDRAAVMDAVRPAQVDAGAGGVTKPATADNRDVGQPGEPGAQGGLVQGSLVNGAATANPATAAASYDAPEAQNARLSAALRSRGKPMEAAQLESANVQAKSAKFTLDKAMEQHVNEQFDRKLTSVGSLDGLRDVLNGSPLVQGQKVDLVRSADGKTADLVTTTPDGQQVKLTSKPIEDSPEGLKKAFAAFSQSMKPAEKVTAMMNFDQFEEQRRQFAENKRLQQQQLGISAAHLGVSQDAQKLAREKFDADLKNDPMRNLPPVVKISVQGVDKGLAGIETAITKAQAEGQWDPKSEGAKQLLARQAQLTNQRNQLLKPYLDAAPGSAAPKSYAEFTGAATGPKTPTGKAVAAAPAGTVQLTPTGGYAQGATSAAPTAAPAPIPAHEISGPNARAGASPEAQARAQQQAATQAADQAAASAQAQQAAMTIKTAQDAYAVMGMPGFAYLPGDIKQRVLAVAGQ